MVTPEIIAAVAASLAAVLSGFGLWLGWRREDRKWRRDALVDTLVQILDSSFASPGSGLMQKRREGALSEKDRELAEEAHFAGISALTRLRVIASAPVVQEAEFLHMADDTAAEMVLGEGPLPEEADWVRTQDERHRRRYQLLAASRKELGLGPAKQIHPGRVGDASIQLPSLEVLPPK